MSGPMGQTYIPSSGTLWLNGNIGDFLNILKVWGLGQNVVVAAIQNASHHEVCLLENLTPGL